VSLRYFNVFGPRQNPESIYSAVIPRFLEQALKHEPLEVHGDGLQSRDFTFIDNVVQGNIRAMETPGVSGEVFNIACNKRRRCSTSRSRSASSSAGRSSGSTSRRAPAT
jgi:UDP-glucose 4-epimerase